MDVSESGIQDRKHLLFHSNLPKLNQSSQTAGLLLSEMRTILKKDASLQAMITVTSSCST